MNAWCARVQNAQPQHGSNRAEKAEDVPKGALQQSLLDSDGHLAGAQISLVPSARPKSMAAPSKASGLSNAEEAEEIRCRLGECNFGAAFSYEMYR